MPPATPDNPDRLLEHLDGLRALAEGLTSSPDLADDLRQETWLAARASPRPHAGSLRAWLAAVMRNLARNHRRAARRRRDHEARAVDAVQARRAVAPAASDVVERASVQRHVVDCLLTLEEPYRETLLLRFYDHLAVAEIAERMDVPVGTVKTRVARGLGRLRGKLGREVDELEPADRAFVLLWLGRSQSTG